MWQFLPSYIWPDVFRAVELTKALDGVLAGERPRRSSPSPGSDRYATMWARLAESFAEARGVAFEAATAPAARQRPAWVPGPRAMRSALTERRSEARGRRLGPRAHRLTPARCSSRG